MQKMVSILIFENSFSFSCYEPSKFWNGSSDDFSEEGLDNMRYGTAEARTWAVTSLEIKININSWSHSRWKIRKWLHITIKTCGSIQDSSGSDNFHYHSNSSPKGSLKFFGIGILQNPHNGSSEMNSKQNEEGRPSLYNQLSFQWEDPLHWCVQEIRSSEIHNLNLYLKCRCLFRIISYLTY